MYHVALLPTASLVKNRASTGEVPRQQKALSVGPWKKEHLIRRRDQRRRRRRRKRGGGGGENGLRLPLIPPSSRSLSLSLSLSPLALSPKCTYPHLRTTPNRHWGGWWGGEGRGVRGGGKKEKRGRKNHLRTQAASACPSPSPPPPPLPDHPGPIRHRGRRKEWCRPDGRPCAFSRRGSLGWRG